MKITIQYSNIFCTTQVCSYPSLSLFHHLSELHTRILFWQPKCRFSDGLWQPFATARPQLNALSSGFNKNLNYYTHLDHFHWEPCIRGSSKLTFQYSRFICTTLHPVFLPTWTVKAMMKLMGLLILLLWIRSIGIITGVMFSKNLFCRAQWIHWQAVFPTVIQIFYLEDYLKSIHTITTGQRVSACKNKQPSQPKNICECIKTSDLNPVTNCILGSNSSMSQLNP